MNNIIQFECFETNLPVQDFIRGWEHYANRLLINHIGISLHARFGGGNKFSYVSKHERPDDNFEFNFIEGRRKGLFNETNMKITQAGGYTPLQVDYANDDGSYRKIMLFLPVTQVNIQEFKDLKFHRYLNIYQSYFESCRYSYILEFFVDEKMSISFLQWLDTNNHVRNIGIYRECMLLNE